MCQRTGQTGPEASVQLPRASCGAQLDVQPCPKSCQLDSAQNARKGLRLPKYPRKLPKYEGNARTPHPSTQHSRANQPSAALPNTHWPLPMTRAPMGPARPCTQREALAGSCGGQATAREELLISQPARAHFPSGSFQVTQVTPMGAGRG